MTAAAIEKENKEIAKQYNKIGAWDLPRLISAIKAFDNLPSQFFIAT